MFKKIFISLIVLLMFIGCIPKPTPPSNKVVTIIGTADLQGMMSPSKENGHITGGISRIATLIKEIKKENPNTIVVSSGDDLMNRFFHTFKGKAIFSLMSKSGYELYVFGNHEFDKGSTILAKALKSATFTPLCSDLDISSSDLKGKCKPYIIKEIGKIRVGFFSLMSEDFPLIVLEKRVKIASDNVNSAKKMIKLLKEKKADIIVAITHIGYKEDAKLAKQVKGIDLIFGGHSHKYVKKIGHIGKTAIVNGGEHGIYLVRVDIPVDEKKRVDSKKITMTLIPVNESVKEDQKIQKQVQKYIKTFPESIVLGKTLKEWNLKPDELRKRESAVADMINDLLRDQFKVDIVLNNSGAFRGKKIYKAGNITDTMLKEIDEFSNNAFIFKLKGKYLKEILEHSAANYGEGGFLQVSGIKYHINLSKIPQILKDETITQKGKRVTDIKTEDNGKWINIDPQKNYTILSNEFIVNHAGDGYFWFRKYGKNFQNTFTTFYSIMASYLQEHGELTPKEKDGRIVVINN